MHFQRTGHVLGIDIQTFHVFCRLCRDYVHSSDLEEAMEEGIRLATGLPKPVSKMTEATVLSTVLTKYQPDLHNVPSKAHVLGLRGMVNMGNTCFMSSVLQALLHNPYLRGVFLSNSSWLPTDSTIALSPTSNSRDLKFGEEAPMLRSDFLRLFSEMYSGATSPHAPYYLLYSVWQMSAHWAGDEQQDAHEFLIFMLNRLHSQMQTKRPGTANATSIIHRVFQGVLRSDVTCCGCGNISTTYDNFFDIPLDLFHRDRDASLPQKPAPSAPLAGNDGTSAAAGGGTDGSTSEAVAGADGPAPRVGTEGQADTASSLDGAPTSKNIGMSAMVGGDVTEAPTGSGGAVAAPPAVYSVPETPRTPRPARAALTLRECLEQ
jgi:ubiquitin carboxyl-terminal hydrolase 22/27/51